MAAATRTLYRAANDGHAMTGTSFAETLDTARLYLDNPGFGGAALWAFAVDAGDDQILDLTEMDAEEAADLIGTAPMGGLGVEEWLPRDPAACAAARDQGYLWALVRESYPAGTTTWIYLGDMDHGDEDPEGTEIHATVGAVSTARARKREAQMKKNTFTVRFDIDDVVELRHAFGYRGGSHAKQVIYAAVRRLIKAGKISSRGLAEETE